MSERTVAVLDVMPATSRRVIEEVFGPDFDVVHVTDDSAEAKRVAAVDADVLLSMWGSVDAETIASTTRAKVIQKLGVGVDKIDAVAAAERGITVLKAAGINADAVAELAVLLILAVGRHLPKALTAARAGVLAKEELRAESFQLTDRRVGLLGLGHIGQALARRLIPFGASLSYYDVRRASEEVEADCSIRYLGFPELVETSDVISLHLPSTPATHAIIDAKTLARTKTGVIIVNTARGSLIDETALAAAIKDGRVLGAGLDVTVEEPLAPTSPLLQLDRVVLTPHIGGAVANNFPHVIRRARDNALAVLDGGEISDGDVVVRPT